MATQVYGIENIKKLVIFPVKFTMQAVNSLKDGWQWLSDPLSFLDEMLLLPPAVKSFPFVKQELSEFSPEERAEFQDWVKDEFDIPDDEIESFVEDCIQWSFYTMSLYERAKRLKKS